MPQADTPAPGLQQALGLVVACAARHRLPAVPVSLAEAGGRVLAADVPAPHAGIVAAQAAGSAPTAGTRDGTADGSPLLAAGSRMTAARLAMLAAAGIASVCVRRSPRVVVIGAPVPAAAQAVSPVPGTGATRLARQARQAGAVVEPVQADGDDPDGWNATLLEAAIDADLVLVAGTFLRDGRACLPQPPAAAETLLDRADFEPAMPLWFGRIGACLVFGLPAEPAACDMAFRVFVRLVLEALQGLAEGREPGQARLTVPVRRTRDDAGLLRCRVHLDAQGGQWATPACGRDPGQPDPSTTAEALALLPEGRRELAAGDVVTLWP